MSVTELVKKLKIEQSNLSHALADLRECNLVTFRKNGKERIYSLNAKTLLPILKIIDIHAKNYCKGNCAYCTITH
jgi:DNA-binding transcriptional ArsR family regulator